MSYDGRLMRQALARFDEDKQRRAENFRARERAVYTKCPRIEEIDRELSHTMAKIIASGLRRGTDPRPAIEALREENLNLQQEKRLLLTRLGLPGDYLEEKPKCSRCNDTAFLGSEVCSCLRGYYAREQNKELSGLLDLGSQCFENFNFDYYSSVPDSDLGEIRHPRDLRAQREPREGLVLLLRQNNAARADGAACALAAGVNHGLP